MTVLTRDALAARLGVTPRTIGNWLDNGCPTLEVEGEERFDLEQVEAWRQSKGLTGRPGRPRRADADAPATAAPPAASAAVPSFEPRDRPVSMKDAAQRADAARKIAQARQQEHDLAQERGLRDLDLAARIRAATTADEVVRLDLEVAALVASGAMKYQRGQALRQLLAQAQRALAEREAEQPKSKAVYLVTAQARELARAFDKIGNGWRRRWVEEAVRLHLVEDLKELPTWDGDMQSVLAALQIDAMGEPIGDVWPARFTAPTVAPALVAPALALATKPGGAP